MTPANTLDFAAADKIASLAPAHQYRAVMAALGWPYTGLCGCGQHIYQHNPDCGFARTYYDDSLDSE